VKALTLWQPWASYIAAGMKRYETRSWETRYRGPLAIHAAARKPTAGERELLEKYPLLGPLLPLPFGAIVATCELVDCILMHDANIAAVNRREFDLGDWYPGRYAWSLVNVVPLKVPFPIKGGQGLWETGLPLPSDMPGMEEVQR